MPRISRFKRRESDRSGFKYFEISLIKDGPWKVSGEEFDVPPPSRIPLGGEGDVATGDLRAASGFDLGVVAADSAAGYDNPTVYITAAGGITPVFTHPWMRVTGSNAAVTVTAIPQLVRGREGQLLTLQNVDSAILLTHGSANALNLLGSRGTLQTVSGMIVNLIFTTANQAWNEISKSRI